MNVLTVILDVLGILAIICFGAFLIALVADLILSVFDKHEGIFFNKKQKEDKDEDVVVYSDRENPNHVEYLVYNEEQKTTNDVDYDKAAEEQINAMGNNKIVEEINVVEEPKVEEVQAEEIIEEKEDFERILNDVMDEAIVQIEKEKAEEQIVVEKNKKDEEKIKVVYQVVEPEEDEFKKLRDDIFKIRRSAFNDLQDKTKNDAETENSLEDEYKRKLKELEDLKQENEKMAAEKEELLKFKKEALEKTKQYEEEKQKLEDQLKEIELKKGEISTAYFTKEEYEIKLSKLNLELKKAETELKRNKKDFTPLERIHKSFEKDSEKLKRKEAIVAKHQIAIYGTANISSIDEAKKQKLNEEIETLKELKESVKNCEKVIEANKDRYPVLKKANEILTANVERIKQEIEVCEKALQWFEENENK